MSIYYSRPLTSQPVDASGLVGNETASWVTVDRENSLARLSLGELQKISGPAIDVRAYGAVGDGVTDDTAAIQAAFDAMIAVGGGNVVFSAADTYLITEDLAIASCDDWEIDLCGSTIKMIDDAAVDADHSILDIVGCDNWSIKNGTLDGNIAGGGGRIPAQLPCHDCVVAGCSNFAFENVVCKNSPVDGWYVQANGGDQDSANFCHNGLWLHCIGTANARQGITFINAYDCSVIGGEYSYQSGLAPQAGIDIERNTTISPGSAVAFTADHTTETFTSAGHEYSDGLPVQLTTTDTLPAGLLLSTTYFIVASTENTFQLSRVYGGAASAITDNGTGTHTATPLDWGWDGLTQSNLGISICGARFLNNAGTGISVVDDADMVSIERCRFRGNAKAIGSKSRIHITGCQFEGSETEGDGMIELSSAAGNVLGRGTVIGPANVFLGPCTDEAINISSSFSDEPVLVTGNVFFNYTGAIVSAEQTLFHDNLVVHGNGTSVNLTAGCSGSSVRGNTFKNCYEISTGQIIAIAGSNIAVTENVFDNCIQAYVLRWWSGSNNLFTNNVLSRSDNTGRLARIANGARLKSLGNSVSGYDADDQYLLDTGGILESFDEQSEVSTTDATVTTLWSTATASDHCYHIVADVFATETVDHDEVASYRLAATVNNDGGTASIVGTVTAMHFAESTSGWGAIIDVSTPSVRVRVTGAAATAINWKASVNVQMIT